MMRRLVYLPDYFALYIPHYTGRSVDSPLADNSTRPLWQYSNVQAQMTAFHFFLSPCKKQLLRLSIKALLRKYFDIYFTSFVILRKSMPYTIMFIIPAIGQFFSRLVRRISSIYIENKIV